MSIEITKDVRTSLIAAIKQYFLDELDQDIGDLMVLFFMLGVFFLLR